MSCEIERELLDRLAQSTRDEVRQDGAVKLAISDPARWKIEMDRLNELERITRKCSEALSEHRLEHCCSG